MFDTIATVRCALETLSNDFVSESLSGEESARAVAELGAIRRLVDALLALAAKRVSDTSAYASHGDRDAAQFYARVVGVEVGEARRVIGTANRLAQLPDTEAAVRDGRLSGRQAQMVADAATRAPGCETELLAAAAEGMIPLRDACIEARARAEDPAQRSARQHAQRRFRMWTAADGMVEGHFRLAPEVGGQIKSVIDAGTQRVFRARRTGEHESHEAYAADAFAECVLGGNEKKKRVGVTTHVVIDHAALVRGNTIAGERCEIPGVGPVSVAWVRDTLGDAFVTAIVKKGRDITTVAHLGRHLPAELQTAMIVGGRECEIVGCYNRGYLERDHCEVDFARGGPTARWNLCWMCSVHHRRKTRGWTLGPRHANSAKRSLSPPEASRDRAPPAAARSA